MTRLAPGTKCKVRIGSETLPCTIVRHLGGGDYIVVNEKGERLATNIRFMDKYPGGVTHFGKAPITKKP